MTTLSRTALIACLATALGAASLAPAYAQGTGDGPRGPGFGFQRIEGGHARAFRPDGGQHMRRHGILAELIGAHSAEAIDVAAVRLTHRLELTAAQTALLETLKSEALAAQSELATAREALMPVTEGEAERPDITARYAGMVAMATARAEALTALQPAFEAFVESLSTEQLELLRPEQRGPGNISGFMQRPNG
jgi:hypothetical protein